jgi:chromosome segregation ATPase
VAAVVAVAAISTLAYVANREHGQLATTRVALDQERAHTRDLVSQLGASSARVEELKTTTASLSSEKEGLTDQNSRMKDLNASLTGALVTCEQAVRDYADFSDAVDDMMTATTDAGFQRAATRAWNRYLEASMADAACEDEATPLITT